MRTQLIAVFSIAIIGLVLTACTPSGPEQVEVRLTEFGIESSQTTFNPGQTYEFVITNAGALNHEFTIMPPLTEMGMQMEGHDMGEMGHNMEGAMLHVGEDQLTPGARVTVQFTFGESFIQTNLEFACHLEGHYEGGMFTPISVES